MNYLREIRETLFNSALNDLSIIRWTLVEQQMKGKNATEYLDALRAHRDARWEYECATKEYKSFLKSGTNDWEEEERLYELVRKRRCESERTDQVIQDMLLESEEYKSQVEEPPYV